MPRPGSRILLLGGDADFNVGDRAILTALARCLTLHDPSAELSIVGQPTLHASLPGVTQVIPRGPGGLRALLGAATTADRILIAGGGLFQDDDSRIKMPYWAARIALLKACNARIAALAVGAGPLQHAESRAAARLACASLTGISVRDRYARDALAACTDRPIEIVPDPAFMLEPAPRDSAREYLRRLGIAAGRPVIAATMRRWFHARGGFVPKNLKFHLGMEPKRDHARFEAVLGTIARSLEQLSKRIDADILLLPGYNARHEADDAACEALRWRLPGARAHIARVQDPRLYKALLGEAALVISARMHPLILAAGMGVPFVGLSYNGKFDGLYDRLGLAARSLPLDLCPDAWGPSTLVAACEAALESPVDLRQRAEALAKTVRTHALSLAFGPHPAPLLEAADA
jgi:polysaccharide pyruvyl transferase WcaK-like protein